MSTSLPPKACIQAALLVLANAAKDKRQWWEIAEALLLLEGTSALDENGLPWIKRAETISGITVNQLRRMTRTLRFLTELRDSEPELAQKLEDRKFSSIEVIGKIQAADRDAAREIIEEERPYSTFRALLDKLDDVKRSGATVSPQSAGRMAASAFLKQCSIWLGGAGESYLAGGGDNYHLVRPKLPLHFANPDFLLFQSSGGRIVDVDAIDCYALPGQMEGAALERRAVQIATESSFFNRFLILLPTGYASGFLPDMLRWLGLPNVQVVDITTGQERPWPLAPDGTPQRFSPDSKGARHHAWLQKNGYQLRRILAAEKLDLSLPS